MTDRRDASKIGRQPRKEYLADEYLDGIHHQAWSPVDWYFPTFGGGGATKIVLAASGIPARSGATVGSASCAEQKIAGSTLTATGNTLTVKNIDLYAIPSNYYVTAHREEVSGFWIARHPGIIGVRLVGTTFQYTFDNSTWINWHTGIECPA